jgi:hypothetical protein
VAGAMMLAGCAADQATDNTVVLNGVEVSQEDYQALLSLKPQAQAIALTVFDETTARAIIDEQPISIPTDQLETFKAEVITLLKDKFGDEYTKFIKEGKFATEMLQKAESSRVLSSTQNPYYLYNDSTYNYYIKLDGGWWGCGLFVYGWVSTECLSQSILPNSGSYGQVVDKLRAFYRDDATPNGVESIGHNVSKVQVGGNLHWFGSIPTAYSEHSIWDTDIPYQTIQLAKTWKW